MIVRLVLLTTSILATGCASNVGLTVHSQPIGAYITQEDGTAFGMSPVYVSYNKKTLWSRQNLDQNGCSKVRTLTARWASGAETRLENLVLCKRIGTEQQITINRDPTVPGLDVDLQMALQVQTLWAQQRQAAAAKQAAAAAMLGVYQQQQALQLQQRQQQRPQRVATDCRTTQSYDGSLRTVCE